MNVLNCTIFYISLFYYLAFPGSLSSVLFLQLSAFLALRTLFLLVVDHCLPQTPFPRTWGHTKTFTLGSSWPSSQNQLPSCSLTDSSCCQWPCAWPFRGYSANSRAFSFWEERPSPAFLPDITAAVVQVRKHIAWPAPRTLSDMQHSGSHLQLREVSSHFPYWHW